MKIFAIFAAVASLVFASSAVAGTCPPKQKRSHKPVVVKIVKRAPVVVKTSSVTIDRVPDLRSAQINREGYCVNGRFMDMVAGQLDESDTITYARFYNGIGITCDRLPGFTFQNTYVGNYAYFA